MLTSKSIRKGLKPVFSALFSRQLVDVFFMTLIYVELIILVLSIIGFWNLDFLKDSIYWFVFAGIPLVFSFEKVDSEKNYFRTIVYDSLKGIVLVEFIANFYSFPIAVELIIMPIILFIGLLQVFGENKKEYNQISNLLSGLLAIITFTMFCIMLYKTSQNPSDFLSVKTLKTFTLPIILTFATLPFLYSVALYSLYESLLLKMSVRLKKKKHKRYFKIKLIQKFHFNRKKLKRFENELGLEPIMKKSDIKEVIKKFKS